MKRFFWGIVAAGVLFGMGCAGLMTTAVGAADTDMFTISEFRADYTLGRDDQQRSTLRGQLTITANFPPRKNHGIAPIFVTKYDGHWTDFQLQSVTDETGKSLAYHWRNNELRIGDKETFVEGQHTYVITYTQRDVTRYASSTERDEFYWDVIGAGWRVPIEQAVVTVSMDESLRAARQGEAFCYQGQTGSSQRCEVTMEGDMYTAEVTGIKPGRGVTMAFGFAPGTFTAYQKPLQEQLVELWTRVQVVAAAVAAAMLMGLTWWRRRLLGRTSELKPIAPEYLPPRSVSVATAGYILKHYDTRKGSPLAAQLIDLAVRHYVRVYEVKAATLLRRAQYEIEIIKKVDTLRPEEREILEDMFDSQTLSVGDKLNLKLLKNNTAYVNRTMDDDANVQELVRDSYGLCEKNAAHRRRVRRWAWGLLLLSVVLVSPPLLVAAVVAYVMSRTSWSLTDDGLALRRYLQGLKMYIGVAEAERLQLLQSPEGAEKVRVDTHDEKQLVKLYERVLPYAILFGQEKSWTKQLGAYYEQQGTSPDWYRGQGAFNAAVFASSMSSLSATTSAVSSYSSSSGGSTGGGFVGGGGGGGGGGGW